MSFSSNEFASKSSRVTDLWGCRSLVVVSYVQRRKRRRRRWCHKRMSSPEEIKVRESLFSASSASSSTEKKRRHHNKSGAVDGGSGGSSRSALSANSGRGRPWRSTFAGKPRSARRAIVRAPWTSPIAAHHLAALQVRTFLRMIVIGTTCCC